MKLIAFFNCIFAFLLSLITIFAIKLQNSDDVFAKFSCYQSVTIVSHQEGDFGGRKVTNGNANYYIFERGEKVSQDLLDQSEGVVFYFDKGMSLDFFQQAFNFNLTAPSTVEGMAVYYGFYEKYHKFVANDGKKVNAQLADTEKGWVLGFPLILTGF